MFQNTICVTNFLFKIPFRNKNELIFDNPRFYTGELGAPGVIDIINSNRSIVEPFADIFNNAIGRYDQDIQFNIDPLSLLHNDQLEEEIVMKSNL